MDKYQGFCEKYNIPFIIKEGKIWMKMKEIGDLLGFGNYREKTRNVSDRFKINLTCHDKKGARTCTFITYQGLNLLLSSSRKSQCRDIAEELGYSIYDFHIVRKETKTIEFIQEIFKHEKSICQKKFGSFIVDLYFPEYKIVVECDESGHYSERQRERDKERQEFLEEEYGLTFVRYDIDKSEMNLAKCIRKLNKLIYQG
jgi:very-short-patch-repair endonuclease